jgi:hypothetical protein
MHVFMEIAPEARFSATEAVELARAEFGVREMYAALGLVDEPDGPDPASQLEADAGTRTPDPIITSDVLYQLSYVGVTGARAAVEATG